VAFAGSQDHFAAGKRETIDMDDAKRLAELLAAEAKADALLSAIEQAEIIAPGRTEQMVDDDIYALAERSFGVTRHWHRRIVRAGPNTLCISAEHPPEREIAENDCVFIDLGPVFEDWEADVGRTYVLGDDPQKLRLPEDLSLGFDAIKAYFDEHRDVTGAQLYAYAQQWADAAGWLFGGVIAGHIVGEYPHGDIPGDKALYRISPSNESRLRDPDATGRTKFWIIEVHLVDRSRTFGGFYERLLVPG
jgi:Xaa-Pro dipeptidase